MPWRLRPTTRREQLRPEGCEAFILQGGRGSGKTRAGAEDCLEILRESPKIAHVLCPTRADARKTCIKGDAGSSVVECANPGEIVSFNQTDLEVRFSNGSVLRGFTAEEPGRLNGPQCHHLWVDEYGLCSPDAIDQAVFGNRLGEVSTFCGTSTPKPRPGTRHTLSLFPNAVVRRMRLQDNRANLAANFIEAVERRYGGTRLGRAEIDGELIEDVDGALWQSAWLRDRDDFGEDTGFRLRAAFGANSKREIVFRPPVAMVKIVVALDPTVSDPLKKKNPNKEMDACGLIVAGLGEDHRAYVLADQTDIMSPGEWARAAVDLYSIFGANYIVAEANQGGELIGELIKGVASNVPFDLVHASAGKRPRAEPVALLYEQGRVSHCGPMEDLENQMCSWDASDASARSPNNVDALVWAFHGLGLCVATGGLFSSRVRTNQ